jgi:hypothetical protein
MAFTYENIKHHYMNCCDQATDAGREFFDHATVAGRELASIVKEKELISTNATVVVLADEDFFEWDPDAYSIYSIFNLTTGERLEPEEAGMRGRERYLEQTTGKPPYGVIHRYHPEGHKVWTRDMSDANTDLQINFKIVPPTIDASWLPKHPIFPPHMDFALVYGAAASFYRSHPKANIWEGGMKSDYYQAMRDTIVGQAVEPKTEENRNRREHYSQWGYEMWVS